MNISKPTDEQEGIPLFWVQEIEQNVIFYKDDRGCIHNLACSGGITMPQAIALAAEEYKIPFDRIVHLERNTTRRILFVPHNSNPAEQSALSESLNNFIK